MRRIKLTQGKYTLVDDEDFEWLNQWKWNYMKTSYGGGYACRQIYLGKINGKYQYKTILMHRIINNTPKRFETDHINRDKLDNQRENLRIVNSSQNKINVGLRKHNTSGYKGIRWEIDRNKWLVRITINNRNINLGRYSNIQQAIFVRKQAEELYFK